MSLKLSITNFLRRVFLGYEVDVLSFSQAGEDLVIRNFFYERLSRGETGFFVDIGAFHPYRHSNTYYLYRAGWNGINVDARPNSMGLFNKIRPRDLNLELAVARNEGTLTYYDFGELSNLNTFSLEYISKLDSLSGVKNSYQIPTTTIASILDAHLPAGTTIDFLNIDIEGYEEEAFVSNDWQRFRPKLIACELYGFSHKELQENTVAALLLSNGYQIYARVPLPVRLVNTVFFVDSEN